MYAVTDKVYNFLEQRAAVSFGCYNVYRRNGKDASKPQGLTKKQKAAQYSKERNEEEKINTRKEEMFQSKIANAIKMIRRAIIEGIRFDYLLVDSWFPCAELLQFIHSRHLKCHLIGMIKMGKTKYETALGDLCARDIIKRLESQGQGRSPNPMYAEIEESSYDGYGLRLTSVFTGYGH